MKSISFHWSYHHVCFRGSTFEILSAFQLKIGVLLGEH
jgi:hypothetical protein